MAPALSVDLASFCAGSGLIEQSRELTEELEAHYLRDEVTEILVRGHLTAAINLAQARGVSLATVALQLEALAERLRSGEADRRAEQYKAELRQLLATVDGMPVEQLVQLARELEGAPSLEASDAPR